MNAEKKGLMHEALTERVLRGFYDVYNQLGYGFLENVYEAALQIAHAVGDEILRRLQHLKTTHPHPGPPLEGEGDKLGHPNRLASSRGEHSMSGT